MIKRDLDVTSDCILHGRPAAFGAFNSSPILLLLNSLTAVFTDVLRSVLSTDALELA